MATMTKEQAELELALLQADADSMTSSDLYIWLLNCGLPPEVVAKLHELIYKTRKVGEKVIDVGKIVIMKIIEFVKENPNLAIGLAVGAVIGVLVNAVPFLGPLLAPIAFALGLIAGHRLDRMAAGEDVSSNLNLGTIAEDVIQITRKFLSLLIEIFNLIFKGVLDG